MEKMFKDSNNPNNKNMGAKKFKGDEYAIPIYTPRSTYNAIRMNGKSKIPQRPSSTTQHTKRIKFHR